MMQFDEATIFTQEAIDGWQAELDLHIHLTSEDALDQEDTISLEDLREEDEVDQMRKAGVHEGTPVDTFINMNGDTAYVTEI